MKLPMLNLLFSLIAINQAHAADGDFHLKEVTPTVFMTDEDGFKLAEGILFKKAIQICGETIAVRVTDWIASTPHPYRVSLEATFRCGI